ncbi:MAG: hypothetical protein RR548_09665, partial [Carnobacterium sp.]|uniref:hypothetical protein n=1 Tax=Carnobacterium sp. TaxID=48221 RepID=UPI002FC634FA
QFSRFNFITLLKVSTDIGTFYKKLLLVQSRLTISTNQPIRIIGRINIKEETVTSHSSHRVIGYKKAAETALSILTKGYKEQKNSADDRK